MSVPLAAVLERLRKEVGFREGPNNANPYGPAQGVGDHQPYCNSGACMCAYWAGYRWWPEQTYGEKGDAYTVHHVQVGQRHGEVMLDRASAGQPCDILAGDLLFYDWQGNGVVDHVETAIEDCPSGGRTHNIGFNTGDPGGCWDLWRDRKYLFCRLRPSRDGGYIRTDDEEAEVAGAVDHLDKTMRDVQAQIQRSMDDHTKDILDAVTRITKAGGADPAAVDAARDDLLREWAERISHDPNPDT